MFVYPAQGAVAFVLGDLVDSHAVAVSPIAFEFASVFAKKDLFVPEAQPLSLSRNQDRMLSFLWYVPLPLFPTRNCSRRDVYGPC